MKFNPILVLIIINFSMNFFKTLPISTFYGFTILMLCIFFNACSTNQSSEQNKLSGQSLFEENCTICHGSDGKLMAAGAPDLTKSILSPEATLSAIELGSPQKGMPAYGKRLGKEELEKLRDYVLNFRKNQ